MEIGEILCRVLKRRCVDEFTMNLNKNNICRNDVEIS